MSERWKQFERDIAAVFGTTRRLMKGTDEVSDIGDDQFPLVLDCKLHKRGSWQVIQWFLKIERAAAGKGKWPVLVLREPGKIRRYAIVNRRPLMQFIGARCKFSSDEFFSLKAKPGRTTPILRQWDNFMRALQKEKRRRKVSKLISILVMENTKHTIQLAVLRPEDLAHIFREGGLLKDV